MFTGPEAELMKKSVREQKPGQGPVDVQILPTERCNASCRFCPLCAVPPRLLPEMPRFRQKGRDLPGGLLDRLADDLYYLKGLKRLTITGGEPLLYSHLVPLVFQFLRTVPDAEMTVVTNGLLLKRFAAFFAGVGLHNLNVSLNAGTPETYRALNPSAGGDGFQRVAEAIKAVSDAKKNLGATRPKVTLTVVLTRHNAGEVEELFGLARNARPDAVTFIPLMEMKVRGEALNRDLRVSPDQFKRFLEEIEEWGEKAEAEGFFLGYAGERDDQGVVDTKELYRNQPCYMGYAFAAVYPSGEVRPCCHCEPVMGNLTENSFIEIWSSEKYQRLRKRMMNLPDSGPLPGCFCDECGHAYENRRWHELVTEG